MNKHLFFIFLVAVFLCACNENTPINHGNTISCDPTTKTVSEAGESFVVAIKSSGAWSASTNQKWVSISPNNGQGDAFVTIIVAAGNTDKAQVLFSNGESTVTLSIERGSSTNPPIPSIEGALNGIFSVSATKKVYFSRGNLRATYKGGAWTWSFATHQWDYIGNAAANNAINGNGTISSNGTVDLFGWSTDATYYGINNSIYGSIYSGDFADWGKNRITNGGNTANKWRTLTANEWEYLLKTRTDADNKYGVAKVNGISGVVLLPDYWAVPSGCGFVAGMITSSDWSLVAESNIYNVEQWSKMEKAGAVFLPAAGYRYNIEVSNVGSVGYYWSATYGYKVYAKNMEFSACYLGPVCSGYRDDGMSVRLVLQQ